MTASPNDEDKLSPAAAMRQIEAACERFELAWKAGEGPHLEDFLGEAPAESRAELFAELFAIEVEYLRQSGQAPSAAEYCDRFREYASAIQDRLEKAVSNGAEATQDYTPSRDAAQNADLPERSNLLDTADFVELPSGESATPTPGGTLPARIERYEIRGLLGEGSFGKVYLGYDADLDRPVAIKSLRNARFDSTRSLEMLRAEARKLAKLRHPAIVAVHDVGSAVDGGCFVVMEYVVGGSLKEQLQSQRMGLCHLAEGIATAAEALHHAHQQGLVHCDVKPGNLLIDRQGGFHVADFGLAVQEDEQDSLGGYVGGTPVYMAPEQTRGETHRLDGRTDVWALGAVLYELLTLRRPFFHEDPDELFRSIQSSDPEPPTEIDPSIPRELERICLKCLSKRMADRYRTALDLAQELRLWRQGVSAARTGDAADGRTAAAPIAVSFPAPPAHAVAIAVVPRGLRSFSTQDSSFILDLLPGPFDRDGLPDNVRFWKSRLEDLEDGDPCALLYGPSGCGKSSLVKAAILPRLAEHVVHVYLEATPEATETRLLRELRMRCPQLPEQATLPQAMAALRGGRIAWPDRKILIVLDQFEQWLHVHRSDSWGELVQSLRHCDGRRLQCLLMVRDDFWLATTRFLQAVEVPLVEGRNVGVVDLFDPPHAKAVLARFGQAYGAIPERLAKLTTRQQRFLDRAVDALAQDGKIVPVRLSLFADMVKGRVWLPSTLDELGGMEGIGAAFLEESFGHRAANPQHRRHRVAAEAVLGALLPEHGGNLRGQVRSEADLAAAAGYRQSPAEFADLVRVLDSELRLITPTDPEGQPTPTAETPAASEKHYQLSHDFLVPSLREWLAGEEKRTWRGRARLALAERAAQWKQTREHRYLPSPLEWVRILAGVPRRQWKPEQRAMLQTATRRYGLRAILFLLATIFTGWGTWEANGRIHARRLCQAIGTAQASELPALLDVELPPYRHWAVPRLKQVAEDESAAPDEQLRASLALVASDPEQVGFLRQRLLDCPLDIFPVVRDRLAVYSDTVADGLWAALRGDKELPAVRFRAGLALAAYQPGSSSWTAADGQSMADALVQAGPDWQRELRDCLRPVAARLIPPLRAVFGGDSRPDGQRVAAAAALADYAANQHELLAELVSEATPTQYDLLFSAVENVDRRESLLMRLRQIAASNDTTLTTTLDRVRRGRRMAGAAITLLRLGFGGAPEVFLAREDPEPATQLIQGLKPRGVPAAEVLAWLLCSKDEPARYSLTLALGEYREEDLPPSDRSGLMAQLAQGYAGDPSSGVRSACGWLLRRWGHESMAAAADRSTTLPDATGKRTWFVDRVGDESFGFVAFEPASFAMGSPDWDLDRNRDEALHTARIAHRFALCDREVTRRQYERFLHASRKRLLKLQDIAPTPAHSVMGVKWYDAVLFCRWLTEQAGMSEADQCYNAPTLWKRDGGGLAVSVGFRPERPGYRLPAETEWEDACRAGTITPYSFGSDRTLLDRYAWFYEDARYCAHLPAELRPNPRGLFDMHGNAAEWCDDLYDEYPTGKPAGGGPYPNLQSRVHRGGGWSSRADETRSAFRRSNLPDVGQTISGFRLAKTLADIDRKVAN